MADTIAKNKFVSLVYNITDETNEVLERIDLPVPLILGHNSQLIEKIEQALVGKKQGDEISVTLSAEEGFGPHLPELTFTDDLANVPQEFQHIGAQVQFQNDQGEVKEFRVISIENGKLTVDGNHPFAGKAITYNITITEVRDPTPEEMTNGVENQPSLH
ncbi:MAG: peptidylprolyl isomerase [Gammaproteobacteria bacterium]|nr:peptidylprolyl isomerase [Gammaproteobacteria bacterium]